MKAFVVAALSLIFALGPMGSGHAQETSADFSGGSMIVGYDSRTCDSSLEGAIRYKEGLSSGPAYCWGDDGSGQLGNGAAAADSQPNVAVTGSHNWVQISASEEFTCAIDDAGDGWCWGDNSNTNLGTGSCCTASPDPVQVIGGHSWIKIDTGLIAACGLATDGKAYCWGNDDYEQQGEDDADPDDGSPSVEVNESTVTGTAWTDVVMGDGIACGIRNDGTAWCWGGTDYTAALGCGGSCPGNYIPTKVADGGVSGSAWIDIDVNYDYGCAIRDDNTAWCWGNKANGRLGNGQTSGLSSTPVAVSGSHAFASISTGNSHACGVTTTGVGYCWGVGTNGRLGSGGTAQKSTPFAVTGSHTWSKIQAGHLYTCGVTTAGDAYCWGYGTDGEIGDGSTNATNSNPVLVNGSYTWADVTAAKTWEGMHSCGIVASGGGAALQYCDGSIWKDLN